MRGGFPLARERQCETTHILSDDISKRPPYLAIAHIIRILPGDVHLKGVHSDGLPLSLQIQRLTEPDLSGLASGIKIRVVLIVEQRRK